VGFDIEGRRVLDLDVKVGLVGVATVTHLADDLKLGSASAKVLAAYQAKARVPKPHARPGSKETCGHRRTMGVGAVDINPSSVCATRDRLSGRAQSDRLAPASHPRQH